MAYDINALKAGITLQDLVSRYGIEIKKAGSEYEALCPFHSEKTPSFRVYDDSKFYCHGCGAGTDHIDFIQQHQNITTKEAIEELAKIVGGHEVAAANHTPGPAIKKEENDPWVYATAPASDYPAPATLSVRRNGEWIADSVKLDWPYHNEDGNLIGYACRVEWTTETNGKERLHKHIIPVCWMTNTDTGESKWRQKSLEKPRVLYGTPDLIAKPEAQLIIVEGEKTTEAARRLIAGTGIIVASWAGGGKAVDHAKWDLVKKRGKVVLYPDCDSKRDNQGNYLPYQQQPGMAAMLRIAEIIGETTEVRIIAVPYPGHKKDGWDLADAEEEGQTRAQVLTGIKEAIKTPAEILAMPSHEDQSGGPPTEDPRDPQNFDDYNMPEEHEEERQVKPPENKDPFRILGWNRGIGYYIPDGFRQVVALKANDHTKLRLLELAPLFWWQSAFASEKRSGDCVDWALAAESLIRRAQKQGIWDEDLIRGRGAWWDNGKAAVHLGDRVVYDGAEHDIGEVSGRFVYELNTRVDIATKDPLQNADACKLVEICENLRWLRPISGKLLAGWVFLAPICGALEWRPHIWITGGAGSGKSTIMKEIIHRLLKENMLFVQGETSEAGIRQKLGHDATPVVFDEIESQSEKATTRVNSIMDLMTISSSETGAQLVKGGANGKAQSFLIRSMFCFSSITVNLKQHAAKTRVTVLDMKQKASNETPEDIQQYNEMLEAIFNTLTPEYIRKMQARAVELIPIIRHNARVFAEAAAMSVGSRRFGDQVGTLIAGAYALHSSNKVTPEAAIKWIENQEWDEHDGGSESKDETSCLQFILGQQIRVDTDRGQKIRAIGELVDLAAAIGEADDDICEKTARDTLRRNGIIVEQEALTPGSIIIANNHPSLERMLQKSPWAIGWTRTLGRIDNAEKTEAKKFGGATSRGIKIPIQV